MDISGISKMSSSNVVSVNPNQLETYADSITLINLAVGDKVREDIRDEDELKRHQAAVKASFGRAICGLPEPCQVKVGITNTFTTGNLLCESLVLETLPGYFATANIYKPVDAKGVLPAVLMVCGHSADGRMSPVYQRVQRTIASAGFVVMGLDPVGQGERYSYMEAGRESPCIPPCTKEHDYAGIQCLLAGITITRYFVHDGICALDYLAARDDVDAAKIGVTGSSGGGTQTAMLMMAAPEKIAAAAPGTFVTDRKGILYSRQAQDAEQIWHGMVKDGFDHADALACMAPKPVMLLTVDSDYFPLEGSHRTIEKVKKLWALTGNEDKLEICTDTSGHAYTFTLANAAADFFSRALKGVPCKPLDSMETLEQEKLYATKTGQVVTSIGSRIIHDFVLDELRGIDSANAEFDFETRRQKAQTFVKTRVENAEPYPLYIKRQYSYKDGELDAYNLDLQPFTWYQQEGIYNFGIYFKKYSENPRKTVIAVWDGGTTLLHQHLDEVMDLCEQDYGVFVVDLTGTGTVSDGLYHPGQPDFYYTRMITFCNNLLVNGDSMPAVRVRGLLRAVDVAEDIAGKGTEISVLTHGAFNLYGLMAKLIDARIHHVDERTPLESIRKFAQQKYYNHNNIFAILMPGMLREFDVDELRKFTQ